MKPGSKTTIFTPAALHPRGLRAGNVDAGETAHAGTRITGAAEKRVRQNRSQQCCLAGRQARGWTAESIEGTGLCAKLAGGTELGDIQINLEDAPFRQHQ